LLIKIKSPLLLFLFGFGRFPKHVTADHKAWLRWARSSKNHHW